MKFRELRGELRLIDINRFSSRGDIRNSEAYKNQYTYKLMVFTDGGATVELPCGERHVCLAHDTVFLLPGDRYRVLNTYGNFSVINLYFTFGEDSAADYTYDRHFDPELAVGRIRFEDTDLFSKAYVCRHPGAAEAVERLLTLHDTEHELKDYMANATLLSLLGELFLRRSTEDGSDTPDGRVIAYIAEHSDEPITADGLARKFGCHPARINRTVKAQTGMPLHAFLTEKRIEKAILYLQETDMSVTEIALSLSFYDAAHFIKIFSRRLGITPAAYRRRSLRAD